MPAVLRECCPECFSPQFIKRGDEYGCIKCQSRFTVPATKKMYKLADEYISRRVTTANQMEAMRKIHDEHPEYTRKDMFMVTGYTKMRISAHFRLYDVHYIRRNGV